MSIDNEVNTIVIGAGISGLAAAKILSKEKVDCLVLEARNRHGGRINTVKWDHGGKSYHADLGANYLHGCTGYQEVQPLFNLASKINVKTSVAPGDVLGSLRGWECLETAIWRRSGTGEQITLEEVSEIGYLMDRCLIRILSNQTEKNRKIPLSTSLEKYLAYVNPLERMSSYLNLGPHFKQSAESKFADDPKRPTQEEKNFHLDWLIEKRSHILNKGPQPSVAKKVNHSWEDRLVLSGFGTFTDFLAKDVNILYKRDYDGKTNVYQCKNCVISLPVGVLKGLHEESSVKFIPELPKAKRKAINILGIPHAGAKTHDKIVMAFREEDIFWDVEYPNIESDDPRLHILNLHYYGQTGVLMFHVWAGSKIDIHQRSDDEIIQEFLLLLNDIYPDNRPLPKPYRYFVTRWSEDPFTLGSYTEGEIGSGDSDRIAYAASLPSKGNSRLLFCGEGTLDSKGSQQCTHGAFLTGVNRAIEILTRQRQQEVTLGLSRIIDYLTNPSIDSLFSTHSMVSRRRSGGNKTLVEAIELPRKRNRPKIRISRSHSHESLSSLNSSSRDDSQSTIEQKLNSSIEISVKDMNLDKTSADQSLLSLHPHESQFESLDGSNDAFIHDPLKFKEESSSPIKTTLCNESEIQIPVTMLIANEEEISTLPVEREQPKLFEPLKISISQELSLSHDYTCPLSWPINLGKIEKTTFTSSANREKSKSCIDNATS